MPAVALMQAFSSYASTSYISTCLSALPRLIESMASGQSAPSLVHLVIIVITPVTSALCPSPLIPA